MSSTCRTVRTRLWFCESVLEINLDEIRFICYQTHIYNKINLSYKLLVSILKKVGIYHKRRVNRSYCIALWEV